MEGRAAKVSTASVNADALDRLINAATRTPDKPSSAVLGPNKSQSLPCLAKDLCVAFLLHTYLRARAAAALTGKVARGTGVPLAGPLYLFPSPC